ncbi:MAG: aquaporin [Chitinophagaceae bacterium]|nr:aquaporin [Chitinophagaceae bacterium]
MKKLITEFIGTFFLVLTVGLAVLGGGDSVGITAPIAIGVALMVMVYAGGHISGGHYNPAVTLGVLIRGKISLADSIGYWIVQLIASAAAAIVAMFLLGDKVPGDAAAMASTTNGLIAEFLGTFALVFVVLNSATAKGTEGNSFYGLAIGFTVTAMAYALGGYSGGAFNPGVGLGMSVMHMADWADFWVYLVGGLAGGAVAAFVFLTCNKDDK